MSWIEYLNLPSAWLIGIFVAYGLLQLVGNLLDIKGKIVPEWISLRKFFRRRKQEREEMQKALQLLPKVQKSLDDMNVHYSIDNIGKRNQWIESVNKKLEQQDSGIKQLGEKMDKNNKDTLELLIESKRSEIIRFASYVIDPKNPVTREQFGRIFKMHTDYEQIIRANGLKNGEVETACRLIDESYEQHMREHTFIEDSRWQAHE